MLQAGQSHFLSIRTALFALAALFCLCAFLYSPWFLPVSRGAGWWHLALSPISIVLFSGGWAGLIARETRLGFPAQMGALGTSLAASILLSLPLFIGTQAWFAVVFIRAWLRR